MNNEKDIYSTTRIKKLNVGLEQEDIQFERSSKNEPVIRKPRPSYNRQAIPEFEKPSSPRQSRSIEERTISREYNNSSNNRTQKDVPVYSRPSSYPRQTRPSSVRPADPRQTRPTDPRQTRPTVPRQTRPTQARPQNGNADVNKAYNYNQRYSSTYQNRIDEFYDEEKNSYRTNRQSNRSNDRTAKKEKKFKGFKKFITIYSAILLVIVITTIIVLGSFLKNYENNQPFVLAGNIASNLTENPDTYLNDNKDKINCLENVDTIIAKTVELINGKKVSFVENHDYRADAPSFDLKTEDNTVAKVTLEQAKKGAFGLKSWKVKQLEVAEYIPDTMSYTLYAPEGTAISINDHPIDESFKTADVQIPEFLSVASTYTEISPLVTYKVSGFTNTPTVKATDANGTELQTTITTDTIVVGTNTSSEFVDSMKPMVDDCIEQYAKYFIHYGGNLRQYIYYDTEWFGYIFGNDKYDPIATQFYEYEAITGIEFVTKESSNYIKYNDHCFSVDVKYDLKINFSYDDMSDENTLSATWVWVYFDKYNEWMLVNYINK